MGWKKNVATCTALAGTALGIMHVVNRLVYHISTIDNLLYNKKEQYYDWRFGRVNYMKQGEGSPILLIHDLNVCSSSYEWNRVIDELSKTNTVYTIDLLGCGCSEKPNLTYTNYLYVQLITDFIKNVIKEKTDVIASGSSSSFTLLACANDDTVINKVLLINPESLAKLSKVPTKRSKMMKYLICTPILGTFIYNLLVNKRTIELDFHTSYYYDQNLIKEKDIMTYFEASHKSNTNTKYLYANIISRFTNANIIPCLSKLNNSIFILAGDANPENILSADQYQNQLPAIEVIKMENTKQLPHMESPQEFIEHVRVLFEIEA